MSACPLALLTHPDLGVRPPGQPLPGPLAQHPGAPGALAEQFRRWLRQRDDDAHAAQKAAVVQALRVVSEDDVRREARHQAALAEPGGWTHWIWAVPAATVAGLLGLRVNTLDAQRQLLRQLRAMAAGLAADANALAVAAADEATTTLLAALKEAEATAPDAPLQWAWLHHASHTRWPDAATREANRLALIWQSHEAGTALLGHGLWALATTGTAPDRAALRNIASQGGAVRLTRRFALRPTTCGEQTLAAGEALTVLLTGTGTGTGTDSDSGSGSGSSSSSSSSSGSSSGSATATGGDYSFGGGRHRCPGESLALSSIEAALGWAAQQRSRPLPTAFSPLHLANMAILLFDQHPNMAEAQP